MGIEATICTGKDHPDQLVNPNCIILNDINNTTDAHMDLKNALLCEVEGVVPIEKTCQCGALKQPRYSTTPNVCHICHTDPSEVDNDEIKNLIFLRTPLGIDTLVLTNFWNMMRNAFTRGKVNMAGTCKGTSILRWVTDPTYVVKDKAALNIIKYLQEKGVTRGYNNFIRNIDSYLDILSKEPSTFAARDKVKDLIVYYRKNKHKIYTNHIPFMDKITRIMEKTPSASRAADGVVNVIDIIMGMASIDDPMYTDKRREGMLARFMENYTIYWDDYLTNNIQGKFGFIRGTLYRSRGTRNSRLVASSITEPHNCNMIELPWVSMIYNLETPITSILLKHGLTLSQIKDFIQYCYSNYNKTMDMVLEKIVRDCRNSLPLSLQRFPSLTRGSKLFLDGGRYKKDPLDFVVGISPLIVRSLNA